jgi:SNF2 family DNA or RNA helicase
MENSNFEIPSEILSEAGKYFSPAQLEQARKLLLFSKVNLSFTKGSPESYFIVTGLVSDGKKHETKVVYKKRLENEPQGPISSYCDCLEYTHEKHCPHVAALYLLYFLSGQETSNLPPMAPFLDFTASVDEYGTMVSGPTELKSRALTYGSLQYLLHDKKIVSFPPPISFKGKLILNIETGNQGVKIRYAYRNPQDEEISQISIFEVLYLFNWKNGETLYLPDRIKPLLTKIKLSQGNPNLDELIQGILYFQNEDFLEVNFDGISWKSLVPQKATLHLEINSFGKKNLCQISLFFVDEEKRIVTPTKFLRCFTFSQTGLLNSFRKKTLAYDFIRDLNKHFKNIDSDYKQALYASTKREEWSRLIENLELNPHTLVYNTDTKSLAEFDNNLQKDFISGLYESFGEFFFRFSEYDDESKKFSFKLSLEGLFEGIPKLQRKLINYSPVTLYENMEVGTWSSKIKFERQKRDHQWFEITFQVSEEDIEVIKNANLSSGLSFVGDQLVILNDQQIELLNFLKRYQGIDNLSKLESFKIPFKRIRLFELFELKKLGLEGILTEEEEALCKKLENLTSIGPYPLPPSLEKFGRPYQLVGYNWLRFLHENRLGATLADDMGLGKTIQAIGFIESIIDQVTRVLIICPVSILLNWELELEKFSTLKAGIYHGGAREFPLDKKIVLTSYGVLRREIDETFKDMHFDIIIFDEVQSLKNAKSIGAISARRLKGDFMICMTGTPVENDLAEFYNIMDLAVPGIWGDLKTLRGTDPKGRATARKVAAPFILRRTKSQVLTDLPPKEENNVYLIFSDEERQKYLSELLFIRKKIQESPSKRKYGEILSGLLKLRQLCLWQNEQSTKIDFLMENLEQILQEGHQVIVFSQFTTYLDIIEGRVLKQHWKYSRVDGSQNIKKRQEQVELFQDGKNRLFLISLKAAGVGLNLTAASYVFLMDPWWNPAVESQAIDRAHRIGQRNPLTVYRPIIKDSVEEKVLDLQETKRQLFNELLPDQDMYFSGKLSTQDFEHLFD